jgi:predicted ATPase
MHIKSIALESFKRFTQLTIDGLPEGARLVVLAGPNGSGKSSLFDAFKIWHDMNAGYGYSWDPQYHPKAGIPDRPGAQNPNQYVTIAFHEELPSPGEMRKRLLYIRSAYRNEADFTVNSIQRSGSALDAPRPAKMIDNDTRVSDDYQRLVSASLEGLYSGSKDAMNVAELRQSFIGPIRDSMSRIFDGLLLAGVGDPLAGGSFFFEKAGRQFHYKNLSGGEKAAFDLILDFVAKLPSYNDTVFCVDEPELHISTKLQAALLGEMFRVIPKNSQLWLATHAIGMMRKARDLQRLSPREVVFLDFDQRNFEEAVHIQPAHVDRAFWARTLDIALDDLSTLVAPERVVICEGRPAGPDKARKAEFDARCYRSIFGDDYPETDFMSVGNASDVENDRLEIGKAFETLVSGTRVVRLVDRDDRTDQEVSDLQKNGVRVLSRRHLEAYLLDDELLEKLCQKEGRPEKVGELVSVKNAILADSVKRSNPPDDIKSISGELYVKAKALLNLQQTGNTTDAFLRDTMAPLLKSDTNTYKALKRDVFDE